MEETGSGSEVSFTELGGGCWWEKYLDNMTLIDQALDSALELFQGRVPSLATLVRRKIFAPEVQYKDNYKQISSQDIQPASYFRFAGLDYLNKNMCLWTPSYSNVISGPPLPVSLFYRNLHAGDPILSHYMENKNEDLEPIFYELLSDDRGIYSDHTSDDSNFLTTINAITPLQCGYRKNGRVVSDPESFKLTTHMIYEEIQKHPKLRHLLHCYFMDYNRSEDYELESLHEFSYSFPMDDKRGDRVGTFTYYASIREPVHISRKDIGYTVSDFNKNQFFNFLLKRDYEFKVYDKERDVYWCESNYHREINEHFKDFHCSGHVVLGGKPKCVEVFTHDIIVPTVFAIELDGKPWFPLGVMYQFIDAGALNALDRKGLKGMLEEELFKQIIDYKYFKQDACKSFADLDKP